MIYALVVTFLTAFVVSLAGAFVASQAQYPGTWWLVVTVVAALAQGLLALYKHQADPPK